ncbi:MAG: hypothetical protein K2W99_06995 [Chthoniobacterales bacterium]|nr:hypothetical protein [Chthoniobacterales bacterium]
MNLKPTSAGKILAHLIKEPSKQQRVRLRSQIINKIARRLFKALSAMDAHSNAYCPSKTEKILNKNPDLKRIIELAFQISEGGEDGAKAFEELKEVFRFYFYTHHE